MNPFTVGGIPGQNNPMVDQVRSLISGRLLPFLRNRPVTQERIDQFVMDVPVEPSEPSTTQEQADDAKVCITCVLNYAGAIRVRRNYRKGALAF